MKWALIISLGIVLVILVSAIAVALFVTTTEKRQYLDNSTLRNDNSVVGNNNAKTVVIVFSRSGNTHVLANHIATLHNAEVKVITAEDYALGIPGWIRALYDARSHVTTITPEALDLQHYDTVYLGAPIWLYSPAPPIWQFAKSNVFKDKHVVLFNTFNSKFEQHFIDEFESLVKQNGAVSFSHQAINRGRMGNQLSTQVMLKVYNQHYQGVSNGS
ncbi:flavodoxin family protein [Pseudoalteromonas xiamenensis]|uniref:Flavodoxin-like domain-containing protein n=1 Tax=Pseudoalteromonas xiamenensis TaxID=882626 RepID=A0A975DKT2_9GAMM|nr:hypothetical protein [Pseudoalteromonas xiamenensis]QTH73563.1 hypothetical protein J5O05_18945 [Pseudoalteromonas xiamenensis]